MIKELFFYYQHFMRGWGEKTKKKNNQNRFTISKLNNKIPLLINTQGWVNGLGLKLLYQIIDIFNPNYIIELNHPDNISCSIFDERRFF